ncbi:MAG: PHP domain-containing protein [Anaerolineae bacterium]
MRVDLHCHTCHSPDSLLTLDALLRQMDLRRIDVVAITDHDTISGARAFHARAPDRILIGEEIKTTQGELLALFIEDEIPSGLSPEGTIEQVQAQGGLVGAPHPFDRLRGPGLDQEDLELLYRQLDFLEVFNARVVRAADNDLARAFAARCGLPGSAGSDAHAPFEVGRAYVEMEPFDDPESFLASLAQGEIVGRLSQPLVHSYSTYARWRKRLRVR